MAKESSLMWPMLIIVAGAGIGGYIWMQRDKTPVGLVVTNAIQGGQSLGETSKGAKLTAGSVEGTWREDENSISVVSESAEKPLLVIYEDGTPIHAEVITMSEWAEPSPDTLPLECYDDDGNMYEDWPQECHDALADLNNDLMDKWRKLAKEHGATEASLDGHFVKQEKSTSKEQSQAAESIYGPMLSLQSHFMW